MRFEGDPLAGLEVGNAWSLRSPAAPHTNWLVGDHGGIPADSLRFLRHGRHPTGGERVEDLALKWFVHAPGDPPEWGEGKPISTGRTLSLLAGVGGFELCFSRDGGTARVVLEEAGDFALWGPGLDHRWRVLRSSVVVTMRWELGASR
ncbi:MAG: hypothetical protein ACK6BG_05760 [Cyanobacteriota bacterium]